MGKLSKGADSMRFPGFRDWTRNKRAAKAILDDRLERSKKKKRHPLEEKLFKLAVRVLVVAFIVYLLFEITN